MTESSEFEVLSTRGLEPNALHLYRHPAHGGSLYICVVIATMGYDAGGVSVGMQFVREPRATKTKKQRAT